MANLRTCAILSFSASSGDNCLAVDISAFGRGGDVAAATVEAEAIAEANEVLGCFALPIAALICVIRFEVVLCCNVLSIVSSCVEHCAF